MRFKDLALCLGCAVSFAHYLSGAGEGYLRRLARSEYLVDALDSIREANKG